MLDGKPRTHNAMLTEAEMPGRCSGGGFGAQPRGASPVSPTDDEEDGAPEVRGVRGERPGRHAGQAEGDVLLATYVGEYTRGDAVPNRCLLD